MLALLVDVECVDGVWIARAPWMPEGDHEEAMSFEDVFHAVMRRKPRGWTHGR